MCVPLCCFVNTSEIAIVERFGRFNRLGLPGLNVICCCVENLKTLSTRVQQLGVQVDSKTKDDVTVRMTVALQYQVINDYISIPPQASESQPINQQPTANYLTEPLMENHGAWRAFYRLTGVHDQLRCYIDNQVRSEIPIRTLDQVYEAKNEIAQAVKDELQMEMQEYGYLIVNVLITDINPEPKVLSAMNEINAAKRLRIAAVEKGEAAKIITVKEAEAEAEAKYLSGVGVSRQRKAIIVGLKESVTEEGVEGTTPGDVMQLVMMTQYLDTIKEATAHGNATLFVPSNPGGLDDWQSQVRQGLLQASKASASSERA